MVAYLVVRAADAPKREGPIAARVSKHVRDDARLIALEGQDHERIHQRAPLLKRPALDPWGLARVTDELRRASLELNLERPHGTTAPQPRVGDIVVDQMADLQSEPLVEGMPCTRALLPDAISSARAKALKSASMPW